MAGRGVDIKLGDGVRELGGLYVLGTERHESRRIDNQLRGRSGRQGDPGETRFYLSGEDDVIRLFAGDRIKGVMDRFKIPEDQPMEAKILSRQIEGAQKKVEEQNFVMRKNVLKYDDVLNRHRGRIYEQRRDVLDGKDLSEQVKLWIEEVVEDTVLLFTQEESELEWDLEALTQAMAQLYQTEITAKELEEDLGDDLPRRADRGVPDRRARRIRGEGGGVRRRADARARALHRPAGRRHALARAPREHGGATRGHPPAPMAQKDPLVEYTAEGRADVHRPRPQRSAARSCSISSTPSSRPRRRSSSSRRPRRRTGTSTTSTRPRRARRHRRGAGGEAARPAAVTRRRRCPDRARERA